MSIEVSVIMISYNKYPQNLFSLYALENQTFDHLKMEVIFVDDASTDETSTIKNQSFNFPFKYIQCDNNVGRSKTKNIGIEASKGDILIFIDSEMILDPEFVEQHYLNHQTNDNLVVTGCLQHYGTYTVFNPGFNKRQKRRLLSLMKKRRKFLPSEKRNLVSKQVLSSATDIFPLFTQEEIQQAQYKILEFHQPTFRELIERYGLEFKDYTMPWKFVITRNVSMRKSLIEAVGPFYEGFQGHGCEDWELGYRLYKYGAKIIENPNVCVYHQEHPISPDNKKENINNYLTFFKQHPNFDVGVMALVWIGKSYFEVNEIITEHYQITEESQEMLTYMTRGFHALFYQIFKNLHENRKVTNLLLASGIENDLQWKEFMFNEREKLINENKGTKLVETLDFLLKL
ncbi:glycosyltransferase family 2 protein [Bacillaceae bacterium Marseille-Q3522]|nr:glycosyltransferase family 2 protein [Bacillaceae bacterium Marseille-Q3522]